MARVTHVKHARQRFAMVPKLDEQGQPVVVPVMRRDGVTPKTDKRGRAITRQVTIQDRSKPLPNYKCQQCGTEILPGQPYKWIEPKMRGMMVRCATCPSWNVWEYSSSLSARIAEIQHNGQQALDDWDGEEASDLESIASDIAGEIRELASEKQDAADNMESGFGHETYQSQELADQADQLESWADEVEQVNIPEKPETDEAECEAEFHSDEPEGDEDDALCPECGGDRANPQMVEAEDVEGGDIDTWRDEVRQAVQDALDNCSL